MRKPQFLEINLYKEPTQVNKYILRIIPFTIIADTVYELDQRNNFYCFLKYI